MNVNNRMNEESAKGGDIMTPVVYNMNDLNAIQFATNNQEVFNQHWGAKYPHHMYGGYNLEQFGLWMNQPFHFVEKWPDFIAYLLTTLID